MGNSESGPLHHVDGLRRQILSIEQKLSSLESNHQHRTVWPHAGSELVICGAEVKCKRDINVLTGPVIGRVSEDSAIILLEIDRETDITCHVCIADENCPEGRELASLSQTMTFPARRPKVFELKNLYPGKNYFVCFSGLSRKDAETRTGRFRTFDLNIAEMRMVAVSGDRPDKLMKGEPNMWEEVHGPKKT
jgi:hypothetical protein